MPDEHADREADHSPDGVWYSSSTCSSVWHGHHNAMYFCYAKRVTRLNGLALTQDTIKVNECLLISSVDDRRTFLVRSGCPIVYVHFAGCVNIHSIDMEASVTPLLFGDQASISAKHCFVPIVSCVGKIETSAVLDAQGILDTVENRARMASVNGAVISPKAACVQFHT